MGEDGSKMEILPFELQDSILRDLDSITDIKATRLLNRHFHELATPHLFRRIFLTVRTDSFERLNQICSSTLSQYVRCLHYNIWEVPLILEREWNQGLARLAWKGKHIRLGHLPRYQEYYNSFSGQVHHHEHSLLVKAFRRLPALQSLEISESEPSCLSSEAGQHMDLAHAITAATCSRDHTPRDRTSAMSGKVSRALTVILAHGEATNASLESLRLQGFRWPWLDMRDVRMWHGDSILNGALKNLRWLAISVAEAGRSGANGILADIPDPAAAVEVWKGLIGRAEGLKRIEVSLEDCTVMA
ncbi:hypothetical protein GJ744_006273 [Endocarpon pusillum]|uniref:F-box domain-containing protein n=1 Tax=Endocarpon pusillum TaxID=364733 RepID=A0A8H7AP56_9EURO|nr:hypothetical protein GJ744_006273 [Endocarpon pusillum]